MRTRTELNQQAENLEAEIRKEFEERGEQIRAEVERELREKGVRLRDEGEEQCTEMIEMACEDVVPNSESGDFCESGLKVGELLCGDVGSWCG